MNPNSFRRFFTVPLTTRELVVDGEAPAGELVAAGDPNDRFGVVVATLTTKKLRLARP